MSSPAPTPDRNKIDSRREAQLLYSLANECSRCRSRHDFEQIARTSARTLLAHTSLIAAVGRIDLDHLEIVHVIPVDYPEAGTAALRRWLNLRERPALMHWLRSREPLVLDITQDAHLLSELERNEIESLQLGRVAAHGVVDLAARSGSYLSFAGVPPETPKVQLERMLRLIVPHLHQALEATRRNERDAAPSGAVLTIIERELLRLVAAGRTNAEIALTRGRSEATVRNQLTVAFRKLGVRNRMEAVRADLNNQ